MSIASNIGALLRSSIGNNLENRPEDVENTKHQFAREGRYKRRVENGYIDQELDDAITGFQRDNNLKIDGIMKPGGETEAMLISNRLKLPKIEPDEEAKQSGYQQVNAVPLLGILRLGLGMTAAGTAQWWANQSADDRERFLKSFGKQIEEGTDDPDPHQDCMDKYESAMDRCKRIEKLYGSRAKRACEETAAIAMSQCRRDVPVEDRRRLQERF